MVRKKTDVDLLSSYRGGLRDADLCCCCEGFKIERSGICWELMQSYNLCQVQLFHIIFIYLIKAG